MTPNSNLQVIVSPLKPKDIDQLEVILRQHLRDRNTGEILDDEIASIKRYMNGSRDEYGRLRMYTVAKTLEGRVVGCMAFSNPDPDMQKHFGDLDTDESVELLNAFVDSKVFRGGGVGKKLLGEIIKVAKSRGNKYLLIHSGPRYKDRWGFYDKMTDQSRGFIFQKYGPGGDAKTWIKKL